MGDHFPGGRFVDHHWLRVYDDEAGRQVVAHDVLGGVFARHDAEMRYFAPDSLEWEDLEIGYDAWLSWLAGGGTAQFYADLRWPGWEAETRVLGPSQGIAVYPFLWSAEARADLAATTRRPVPLAEILALHSEFCTQLGLPDPGFLG